MKPITFIAMVAAVLMSLQMVLTLGGCISVHHDDDHDQDHHAAHYDNDHHDSDHHEDHPAVDVHVDAH